MKTQSITTTIRELRLICSRRKKELIKQASVPKELADDIKILIQIKNRTGESDDWIIQWINK